MHHHDLHEMLENLGPRHLVMWGMTFASGFWRWLCEFLSADWSHTSAPYIGNILFGVAATVTSTATIYSMVSGRKQLQRDLTAVEKDLHSEKQIRKLDEVQLTQAQANVEVLRAACQTMQLALQAAGKPIPETVPAVLKLLEDPLPKNPEPEPGQGSPGDSSLTG